MVLMHFEFSEAEIKTYDISSEIYSLQTPKIVF